MPNLQINIETKNQISFNNSKIEINIDSLGDLMKVKLAKILSLQTDILQKVVACVEMNWLCLLVGDCNGSVRCLIEAVACLQSKKLTIVRLNSETDALELLGTYEQVYYY